MNSLTLHTSLCHAIDEHMRKYRLNKWAGDKAEADRELRLADGYAKRLALLSGFHSTYCQT